LRFLPAILLDAWASLPYDETAVRGSRLQLLMKTARLRHERFSFFKGSCGIGDGGSRGIGAATVRLLVEAGAKVVFNYQKARAAADALVKECGAERCHAVACDLSGTETAAALVEAAVERFGRVDIWW